MNLYVILYNHSHKQDLIVFFMPLNKFSILNGAIHALHAIFKRSFFKIKDFLINLTYKFPLDKNILWAHSRPNFELIIYPLI